MKNKEALEALDKLEMDYGISEYEPLTRVIRKALTQPEQECKDCTDFGCDTCYPETTTNRRIK